MSSAQRRGLLWDCSLTGACAVHLCAARAARLRPPNIDLLAFQRRGPRGCRCGWACRDATVSIQIRFCASSSKGCLGVEEASRASGRSRSDAGGGRRAGCG
ncbi:hypothetical protein C8Q77DRAFT_1110523 [Trametes polyzona]|nr:hypothetical protein C8Q77DRAFT_1110523 [Trametes polyzona]